jgi:hypothetical protein
LYFIAPFHFFTAAQLGRFIDTPLRFAHNQLIHNPKAWQRAPSTNILSNSTCGSDGQVLPTGACPHCSTVQLSKILWEQLPGFNEPTRRGQRTTRRFRDLTLGRACRLIVVAVQLTVCFSPPALSWTKACLFSLADRPPLSFDHRSPQFRPPGFPSCLTLPALHRSVAHAAPPILLVDRRLLIQQYFNILIFGLQLHTASGHFGTGISESTSFSHPPGENIERAARRRAFDHVLFACDSLHQYILLNIHISRISFPAIFFCVISVDQLAVISPSSIDSRISGRPFHQPRLTFLLPYLASAG